MNSGAIGAVLGAAIIATAPMALHADDYPGKPIELVVQFNAGGGADTSARIITEHLSEELGQPILVRNLPGGSTTIGTREVVNADPDGYTLLYTSGGTVLAPFLVANAGFDPQVDLTPIAKLADHFYVLLAAKKLPFDTFDGMVDYAKANPGALTIASADPVTAAGAFKLKQEAGIDLVDVAYTGGSQVIQDLVGGHVDLGFMGLTPFLPLQDQINALAVPTLDRFPGLPNIPTLDEMGLDGFHTATWYTLSGPAGLPDAVVERLESAVAKVMTIKDVQDRLAGRGLFSATDTSTEAAAMLHKQYAAGMKSVFDAMGIEAQ